MLHEGGPLTVQAQLIGRSEEGKTQQIVPHNCPVIIEVCVMCHLLHTSQKISTCSDVSVADCYLHQ